MHVDNRKKDILVLGICPTQGSDNTALTKEAEYYINFSEKQDKICLSQHYNGNNSFLFVNWVKIYQFKLKDSEINVYPLCLANILFWVDFLFGKVLHLVTWKGLDYTDMCMIFQLILVALVLLTF